jgi:hypothetical protein
MTTDERRIANAALRAGSHDNHDQLVVSVAAALRRDPQTVEAVLQKLRIRMVLACVSATNATSETASVRYGRGMDWTDEE